jgi:head-tail adaptor
MLPASELAQIRSDLENLLPDYCNILSLTRTSDSQGGWTETWGTASLSVSCRFDFIGGKEAINSGALKPYSMAIVTLPQSTTITAQNRLEFGGNTYTVQAVNLGSWLGVKRASVELV